MSPKLTQTVSCAGCAAKVDPVFLQQVLRQITWPQDERVLVGFGDSDDAGVFAQADGSALVATTDFFTPIVDDPYTYGAAAAANALSDIYAMGASPLYALSIVHYPESLGAEVLTQVLQGAADICAQAACPIIGGHSIRCEQMSFGLAITGRLEPGQSAITNGGARPGDALILSKALGTGILATALKKDCLDTTGAQALAASLTRLNAHAGSCLHRYQIRAATDITGFGLVGHAAELASASAAHLRIYGPRLPLLPGLADAIAAGCLTRGDHGNPRYAGERLRLDQDLDPIQRHAACDPQSSGGLLMAVAQEQVQDLLADLHAGGDTVAAIIGEVVEGPTHVEILSSVPA
ncbi:MAG: selenide, water dikinase SelD [Planctomycetota bacterium]|nr:MAG: selenide, water dikinase SelD [Planctomycetota bacterium]